MYWRNPKKGKHGAKKLEGWNPPTEMINMKFSEWLAHANEKEVAEVSKDDPHWYFRVSACSKTDHCPLPNLSGLYDELPFFDVKDETLLMVEPKKQRGIHCRFGMAGVIAENHFDGSRNTVALLGGERRYVLSSQKNCENMALVSLS